MLTVAEMAQQPCAEREEVWGEDRLQGPFPGVLASLLPFSSALIYSLFFFLFPSVSFKSMSFFLFPLPGPTLIQTHLLVCISVVVVMILTLVSPLPFATPAPIFWP